MSENQSSLRLVLVCAVVVLAAVVAPSVARAEERKCTGTLNGITVDNLKVPKNATCTLNGTFVKGTIKVGDNAILVARGVRVIGNVQAENAKSVRINASSRIGGSVQVKQGEAASVTGSKITGDIQYFSNDAALTASDNRVGGSIQVIGNDGPAAIFRNRVNGNLQCKENNPAPTGGANVVGGNKEDQCKAF
jgi:cytoskeletal protein CcmA (bactofilin family)